MFGGKLTRAEAREAGRAAMVEARADSERRKVATEAAGPPAPPACRELKPSELRMLAHSERVAEALKAEDEARRARSTGHR